MVFELDADLPLRGLIPDEGELEELLCRGAAGVRLDQAAVDEVDELLGPAGETATKGFVQTQPPPLPCF